MASADLARTAVGILGNIIAFCLFLSPMPTFAQIWKKGSVEEFSPVPYLATLLQCMLWVVYGIPLVHPHSLLVVTINVTGCAIELTYVVLFLIFSDRKKRLKVMMILLLEAAFVAAVLVMVLTLAHTHERRSMIIGVLCVVFGTMMYVAPLSVMRLVIKTKSVEYMPFFLSVASFANGLCWTCYALIRFDLFITLPNGLGTLFAVVQLVLYATYYKSTKRQIEERERNKLEGSNEITEVVVVGGSKNKISQNGRASEIRET